MSYLAAQQKLKTLSEFQLMAIWVVGLLSYRLLAINLDHLDVFFDEAYYYYWSQFPDLGYYSKPPVVAWLMAVSTSIFGATAIGLKFFSPILYAASGCMLYLFAARMYDRRVALLAAMVFTSTPIVGFNSLFITTDAPLFFFWILTIYLFVVALESKSLVVWSLLGVSAGLGMLSKYTFVALPMGLFLYLIVRKQLMLIFTLRGVIAVTLCLALFSLNLYWNAQHGFIAFNHTREIAQLDKKLFNFDHLLEFLFSQCLIFGFVWSILLLPKCRHLNRKLLADHRHLLLLLITIPIIFIIASQAFLSRAFVNWAGPFVLGASIVAAILLMNVRKSLLIFGFSANLALLSLFNHWPQILSSLDIQQSKKNSPYYRIAGWREASWQLLDVMDQHPDSLLVSNSRDLLAYASYHTEYPLNKIAFIDSNSDYVMNHYDLVANLDVKVREPHSAILIISKHPLSDVEEAYFSGLQNIREIDYQFNSHISRYIYVYLAQEFIGYEQ